MSEGKEALTPIAIIKSRDSELMIGISYQLELGTSCLTSCVFKMLWWHQIHTLAGIHTYIHRCIRGADVPSAWVTAVKLVVLLLLSEVSTPPGDT